MGQRRDRITPQREARTAQDGRGGDGERAPVYNIVGDKVALGPEVRDVALDLWYRGDNDFEIALLAGDPLWPRTRTEMEAEYDEDAKRRHHQWVGFLVYDRASGTPIGGVGLRDINWVIGCAELGVTITQKDYWGNGYGSEAVRLILDYGFTVLGLHNVQLSTYAYNERAIRSYIKVGFKEIGRRREAQRLGEKRYDVVYMDILRSEFRSPLKPVIELP